MARVTVTYVFADGERIHVHVTGKRSYPDAIAELRATAVKGLHEALEGLRVNEPAEEAE